MGGGGESALADEHGDATRAGKSDAAARTAGMQGQWIAKGGRATGTDQAGLACTTNRDAAESIL